jgi:PAS domain S-box-containing protein
VVTPKKMLASHWPELMLWLVPAVLPLVVHAYRHGVGLPMVPFDWLGVPLIGVALAVWCHAWLLAMRGRLSSELATRKAELEESQRFLAEVVDTSPGALAISDREGRITFASRAAETLVGAARGGLVGRSVAEIYAEGATTARDVGRRLRAEGGWLSGYRTTVRAFDGRKIPVELSAATIHDRVGGSQAVLGVATDLTARLEEEKLALEAERLRVLGESVAGIAHELNNPLTGVVGYLQVVLDEGPPADLAEPLTKAAREAERMVRTIRTLLAFGHRRAPSRQPADLAELARQVRDFREYQLHVNDISIQVEGDVLPPALVDPDQVRQVLLNLVKNAEDAIRDSRVGGRIVIRTRIGEGVLRVEVEDDGPGVPQELAGRIFEHFFTTKPAGHGTGLGLAICRQILDVHGGRVFLERPPTGGARFVLEFPPGGEPVPVAPPEPPTGALRALVVDDEEAVRDYVAAVLRAEGHAVTEAASGTQAILRAEAAEFDVVLMDRGLPDLRGEECREEIIARRPSLRGRVILMSGDIPEGGGDALFLLKPMTIDEIRGALARALSPAAVPV